MTGISASDVWDVLNISDADIAEAKVLKMIKCAEVSLELELNVFAGRPCAEMIWVIWQTPHSGKELENLKVPYKRS